MKRMMTKWLQRWLRGLPPRRRRRRCWVPRLRAPPSARTLQSRWAPPGCVQSPRVGAPPCLLSPHPSSPAKQSTGRSKALRWMEDSGDFDFDCTSSAAQSLYLEAARRAIEVTASPVPATPCEGESSALLYTIVPLNHRSGVGFSLRCETVDVPWSRSPFSPWRHSGLDDGDTAARCSGSSVVESRSSGDGGVGGASRRLQHLL